MPVMTEERRAFAGALRDFAARECATAEQCHALTRGGTEFHHAGLYSQLAELGYLGVGIPEVYGGSGGSIVDTCVLAEEVFYAGLPVFGIANTLPVAGTLMTHASEELKKELLPGICDGVVHALGFSEPEAGSDLGNLRCRARRSASGYVVNGQKTWTSNAQHSDFILLMARTGEDSRGHGGLTMLSVPMDSDGITVKPIATMAGPGEVNDVYFTEVTVSADRVVGEEGRAWPQLMSTLNRERLLMGAMYLGLGRRAFDDVLRYVKERRQFGRPIGGFQVIRHRLADLATELHCCQLALEDLAMRTEADPAIVLPREASMLKLKVTETAKRVVLEGMQMMGGYGYATEYGMEQLVRHVLAGSIYGGTNEIQREIIGKTLGL